ncbi:MAG: Ig-like domain-containing protein [Bifidobacteriaceae bacterium]|jgi:uncharacterized protein YjdB|nr:Ig-like domain-containing protein [Bifidobacteriaceae bacterium]
MFCDKCGSQLVPGAAQCGVCGETVAGATAGGALGATQELARPSKKGYRPKTLTIILAAAIALVLGAGAGFGLNAMTAKSVGADFGKLASVGDLLAIAPGQKAGVSLLSDPKTLLLDKLSLTSNRPSVLRVSEKDGKTTIEGVKAGEAKLTVESSQRHVKKTYSFIVSEPPTAITGLPDDLILDIDEVYELEPVLEPAESTYPIGFESSDEAIVSVSADGAITAHETGAATIKVVSGDIAQEIEIDAHRLVQSVNLPTDSVDLKPGETYQIDAAIEPSDATYQDLTYKTDDPTSALVNSTGLVTAVWDDYSNYSVDITITSKDGPESVLKVHVSNPYRAEAADGPVEMPGTTYQVTPLVFDTAVPNVAGLSISYGVGTASTSAFLNELRNGSFDVYVSGTSGGWEKIGSFTMTGGEWQDSDLTFTARTISRVAVVPSASGGSGNTWTSGLYVEGVTFEGQAPPGDT